MNVLSYNYQPLPGYRIIEDPNLFDLIWQETIIRPKGRGLAIHRKRQVSVPSRRIYQTGDTIIIHPNLLWELQQQVGKSMSDEIEKLTRNIWLGQY
jgi:hypothetical protein